MRDRCAGCRGAEVPSRRLLVNELRVDSSVGGRGEEFEQAVERYRTTGSWPFD